MPEHSRSAQTQCKNEHICYALIPLVIFMESKKRLFNKLAPEHGKVVFAVLQECESGAVADQWLSEGSGALSSRTRINCRCHPGMESVIYLLLSIHGRTEGLNVRATLGLGVKYKVRMRAECGNLICIRCKCFNLNSYKKTSKERNV